MTSQILTQNSLKDAFVSVFQKDFPGETAAAHPARNRAREVLPSLEIPTRKNEAWKYTNLKPIVSVPYQTAAATLPVSVQNYFIPGLEADVFVFVNGKFQPGLSTVSLNKDTVVASPLSALTAAEKEIFDVHFGSLADSETDFFTALNTAYATEGVMIRVPQGKIAAAPVHLLHIQTSGEQASAHQVRNFFLIEKNAQVNILESVHSTENTPSFANSVTEIRLNAQASAQYIQLQMESDQSSRLTRTEVLQEAHSRFSTFTLTFGGQLIRNNLNIKLNGPGCESILMGVYLLSGLQHVDNHTQVDHIAPHCYSNELYKGIISDKATGVFNGKIHVHRDAQKTNAFQSNRNILLSDTANIFTKPQLEIYADDVKCSHGATTGRLDEDALFYLQARGIPVDTARLMLVHAFIMEVVENISMEPLADFIATLIENRF
ncbi:MAG: Fe-S cluster assembly protein SufD [Bacteroidia bacterium]|nr:Fe-S cluster assembly protein SufD [Bacteroidia bacterium]